MTSDSQLPHLRLVLLLSHLSVLSTLRLHSLQVIVTRVFSVGSLLMADEYKRQGNVYLESLLKFVCEGHQRGIGWVT